MREALSKSPLKLIPISLLHYPINIFLLLVGMLYASLTEIQAQLIGIVAILLGVFIGWQTGLVAYFAIYLLTYFLHTNVEGLGRLLISALNRGHNS